ncbi:MAG: zinc/iron-chelating domain-containing protein [Deltaproteobacteria bacterium]|nr:MAG: zinc/iron-chelating domain-containing protein [Deltaproteobacteria bacterium]
MLLDAYHIADTAIDAGIRGELKKGRKLACAKGCSSCCTTHVTIPVYPLEIMGIYWYTIHEVKGRDRLALLASLKTRSPGGACPFLVDNACGIHPMRPLACRHFNVFDTPCLPGEDPFYTRRKDVFTPNEKEKNRALSKMLPFHGIRTRVERKAAIRSQTLNGLVKNMQELDWTKLAHRIEDMTLIINRPIDPEVSNQGNS